jgi:hypothetical protein
LVVDDAGDLIDSGYQQRSNPDCILKLAKATQTGLILLKMRYPVAEGRLWEALSKTYADRLVCVVAADDLRRKPLRLSRALSWEATLDDLSIVLATGELDLLKCRHLIVTFSLDGALWLDRSDHPERACFCFDPQRVEGEWAGQFDGESFGYQRAMTAALAYGLARSHKENTELDLRAAIKAGLLAMRDLCEKGHGLVKDVLMKDEDFGYPIKRIVKKICSACNTGEGLADRRLQWPPSTTNWSIVEALLPGELFELAKRVVKRGTQELNCVPHAQFLRLVTADRAEIEALRHIRLLMQAYDKNLKPKRPLSIGVFGPPGAGKSFGIEQLAEDLFGKEAFRKFNLSQFRDSAELNGAFHQVRDIALAAQTPVVFWDEFDSRELYWLQYLLAPMQDGRFQDGQLNHAIGKCVFVFAGGTSSSLTEFSPRQDKPQYRRFQLCKGPDFVSRLDAFMDVLGPNRRPSCVGAQGRQSCDNTYVLRRALLIRSYLGCGPTDVVNFDDGLLNAMLLVSEYRHGARSLEKLIEMVRDGNALVVRRSRLPRPEQLQMHVDVKNFTDLMNPLPAV